MALCTDDIRASRRAVGLRPADQGWRDPLRTTKRLLRPVRLHPEVTSAQVGMKGAVPCAGGAMDRAAHGADNDAVIETIHLSLCLDALGGRLDGGETADGLRGVVAYGLPGTLDPTLCPLRPRSVGRRAMCRKGEDFG